MHTRRDLHCLSHFRARARALPNFVRKRAVSRAIIGLSAYISRGHTGISSRVGRTTSILGERNWLLSVRCSADDNTRGYTIRRTKCVFVSSPRNAIETIHYDGLKRFQPRRGKELSFVISYVRPVPSFRSVHFNCPSANARNSVSTLVDERFSRQRMHPFRFF